MAPRDDYVRTLTDTFTKARAEDALAAMGLSVCDAIRLLMRRIADERRLPFDWKVRVTLWALAKWPDQGAPETSAKPGL